MAGATSARTRSIAKGRTKCCALTFRELRAERVAQQWQDLIVNGRDIFSAGNRLWHGEIVFDEPLDMKANGVADILFDHAERCPGGNTTG